MRGLGLGNGLGPKRGAPALTQVFSEINAAIAAWTTIFSTTSASALTNPEDGGLATDIKEDVSTNNHGAVRAIPLVSGHRYRFRVLLRMINETLIEFTSSVDGGKAWIGDPTTGATVAVAGFFNGQSVSFGGGWYAVSVDLDVVAAGGSPDIGILICKPGPTNSFAGAVTDGVTIGSVRIYRIGA